MTGGKGNVETNAALVWVGTAGVVFDVRVPVPPTGVRSDALEVDLDHREKDSARVYFPYSMEAGGAPVFAEVFCV